MRFPSRLEGGVLIRRYKRFFVDVALDDGTEATAHCPNPGAMLGLNAPGSRVWLSRSDDPKRKLALTLQMVEADGTLVGVNTLNPNRLAAEALEAGALAELSGYASVRREVAYDEGSRVDFLLEDPAAGRKLWLEVKNCHFSRTTGLAEFPDCVAARSAKHMGALARRVAAGDRAAVLWVIQRDDCDRFRPAADIDPVFARAAREAAAAGVETLAVACTLDLEGVRVTRGVGVEV